MCHSTVQVGPRLKTKLWVWYRPSRRLRFNMLASLKSSDLVLKFNLVWVGKNVQLGPNPKPILITF